MYKIKQKVIESKTGWEAKQVMNLIYEKTGVRYHEVHVYRLLHRWGLSPSSTEKVCKYCLKGGKGRFQKRILDILTNPTRIHRSSTG